MPRKSPPLFIEPTEPGQLPSQHKTNLGERVDATVGIMVTPIGPSWPAVFEMLSKIKVKP